MENKLITLQEAIRQNVRDGTSIVMGTDMEAKIPFSAGHEIIRQGRRNLTLIGPISDILFDQLIGAGCVSTIRAAWVGNVSAGSAYNLRRAVEQHKPHKIEIEDHSNFTIALGLHAAALGATFLPSFTALGSDIVKENENLKEITCPFTSRRMIAVRAIEPDLAIVHVQRADSLGNCHIWGNTGITIDAVRASKRVIVVAEEIVSTDVIASDPNRTLIPGFLVSAVVEDRWGAHPSPVQGYYNRDNEYFSQYHRVTATEQGFNEWLSKWVLDVSDRAEYLKLLGAERVEWLKVKRHALSEPVDYGY